MFFDTAVPILPLEDGDLEAEVSLLALIGPFWPCTDPLTYAVSKFVELTESYCPLVSPSLELNPK